MLKFQVVDSNFEIESLLGTVLSQTPLAFNTIIKSLFACALGTPPSVRLCQQQKTPGAGFLVVLMNLCIPLGLVTLSIYMYKGRVPEKKSVFLMVFCQTGGRGVSEGSEKTILLF